MFTVGPARTPTWPRFLGLTLATLATCPLAAAGATLHKSGPIQITADGQFVFAVSPDHDAVARLRTSDNTVAAFVLPPAGGPHHPRALDVTADGAEIWVAASESDRVFVLDGATGGVLATLPLPYGSAPIAIALSPDGSQALVLLHHAAAVAVFDVPSRTQLGRVDGLFRQPFGVTYTTTPNEAWVTHTVTDGEDSHVTAIDTLSRVVSARVVLKSVNPKEVAQIANDPDPIPEGGYLLLHGHPAQQPGSNLVWLLAQYQNFHNDQFSPDSTVQSAAHKINLATRLQDSAARIVFTAVYAHNNTTLLGPGWNAQVSGPIDVAFSADGVTAYVAHNYSNDVLVLPANAVTLKPAGANPLTEIPVGDHPIGLVTSPTADRLYVLNQLSRDISVINTLNNTELARVPATPGLPEPFAPDFLNGAKLFNSSADPRLSQNHKVACASCHNNQGADGLIWDFAQLAAGSRKTLNLRGLALSFGPPVAGRGQLHRGGDLDEVQDFEFIARGPTMGGAGFLANPNPPLGAANAGLNPDLDAIATYLLNLPPIQRSPHRKPDGALSPAALRGAVIFRQTSGPFAIGCTLCHAAPNYTDRDFHDVGGFVSQPEHQGPPFNTPTLVGAWNNAPFTQAVGQGAGGAPTLGDVLRDAQAGGHGNTAALNRTQIRDVEAFLNVIDGQLAATDINALIDDAPPRVVDVLPVSLNAVDVIFDESVNPASAANPANYVLNDGARDYAPTAAVVDAAWGNRVRLSVALAYRGCPITYTLLPGPIQDRAGDVAGGANNTLDSDDPANQRSFTLDGAITVTFGDTGHETFNAVSKDAGFVASLPNWSHMRWWLYPNANPEMKGFVSFDFTPTLQNVCGVTSSAAILDARFTAVPLQGHRNTIELRRCFLPWGEPPRDWCQNCPNTVTVNHALRPSIPWHQAGAKKLGGSGTSPSEYYPTATNDLAATLDAVVQVTAINQPVEFAGPLITDAFRFWFDNPTINYGYGVEVQGNNGTGVEFRDSRAGDGTDGFVLSITFAIPATPCAGDLTCDGQIDQGDLGALLSDYGCTGGGCVGDVDGDGATDQADLGIVLAAYGQLCP